MKHYAATQWLTPPWALVQVGVTRMSKVPGFKTGNPDYHGTAVVTAWLFGKVIYVHGYRGENKVGDDESRRNKASMLADYRAMAFDFVSIRRWRMFRFYAFERNKKEKGSRWRIGPLEKYKRGKVAA